MDVNVINEITDRDIGQMVNHLEFTGYDRIDHQFQTHKTGRLENHLVTKNQCSSVSSVVKDARVVFVAFGAASFFIVCARGSGGTDGLAGTMVA